MYLFPSIFLLSLTVLLNVANLVTPPSKVGRETKKKKIGGVRPISKKQFPEAM